MELTINQTAAKAAAKANPLLGNRRRSRRRRPAIIVALVAAAGVAAWQLADRFEAPAPPTYTTAAVTRGDIVTQVTATGTLSPVVSVQVGSQVSGRIAELRADYNSRVAAGDVIARIEPQLFESAVAQARARLVSATADVARARAVSEDASAQYGRIAALAAKGVVSRAELDSALASKRSAEAGVSSARSGLTVAQATVQEAEVNLAYTTIKSPIDGVVISRSVDVGQTVSASTSAPTLFVIAGDLRQMVVHASVAESDVGQLAEGMRVEFTVDAFPDKTFAGTVSQVRYEATEVSSVVTYDAVIAADNADGALRPGMTANVTFITDERRDVLMVSNRALRYRPANAEPPARRGVAAAEASPGAQGTQGAQGAQDGQGGQGAWSGGRGRRAANAGAGGEGREVREPGGGRGRAVWVLRNGAPERVRVQVGLSDGTNTEVVGGELSPDDLVIVSDGSDGSGAAPARPGQNSQRGGGRRRGPPSIL